MIDAHTIYQIKESADVIDVLSDFITLKRAGSNYKANCPFHNEKTPSFVVSPAKGIYKCFGCGKAGDSVKFVMEHEQLNYVEALRYLAKKYNIEIKETELTAEEQIAKTIKDSLYIVNEFARDTFLNNLLDSDEGKSIGLSYFSERGYTEPTIKKFQLGYTLNQSDSFTKLALDKGYQLDILKQAGLTSKKEGSQYDFFRGRVMFPIHSISGKVLGFGGRILQSNAKAAKYVNTSDTEIYDKSSVLYGIHFARESIRKLEECLLVEGYTDVISLSQEGIENVVASSGTSLTTGQVRLIKRYTDNITLLFDGDNAGVKAALRGVDIILENGLNVKVCLLPPDQDPDSFVQKEGGENFRKYIEETKVDFILFKTQQLNEEAKNDPVKKAANVQDIVASIAKIPDAIKRNIYITECASLLKISEQILVTEVNKVRKQIHTQERKKAQKEIEQGSSITPEQLVAKDDETQEIGVNIEFYERNVIRILVEHGFRPFTEKKPTVEFILEDLGGMILFNETHQKIKEIAENRREYDNFFEEDFFLKVEDDEIKELCITLITSPHFISENWGKKGITIQPIELTFKEDVETELYWLKFYRLKLLEKELMQRLKDATEEDIAKLLNIKKHLDEDIRTLAAKKGVSVLRN